MSHVECVEFRFHVVRALTLRSVQRVSRRAKGEKGEQESKTRIQIL